MATKVAFSWPQIMDSYSPDFSITATFTGWAEIKDLNANEIEIKACFVQWDGMLAKEPVSVVRGCVGSAQNFFLGKCREAARKVYQQNQDMVEAQSNCSALAEWPRKNIYPASFEDMADTNGGGGR
jgi:hypothetical protein